MKLDGISQNIAINSGKYDKEKEYWMQKLSGETVLGGFPLDIESGRTVPFALKGFEVTLDEDLSKKIIKISNGSDQAMLIIFIVAIQYLIGKYSLAEDIITGTPVFKQANSDNLINNVLPIRTNFSKDDTFRSVLGKVKNSFSEALKNQNYPFFDLAVRLDLIDENQEQAILKNIVLHESLQSSLYIENIKADTVFCFGNSNGKITLKVEYNKNLYGEETINGIVNNLVVFFKKTFAEPGLVLADSDIISDDEKIKLLYDFNKTQEEYKNQTITELFEEQVESVPDNIALVFEDKQMTYKELNEKSNQMARVLRGKGVGLNSIVALMLERSFDMISAIFAVLKAGGAYLPIDPSYPEDRINYMLQNSNAAMLLTSDDFREKISYSIEKVFINESIYTGISTNLERVNKRDDLAYIIYTSGTTGNPKGVMIEHQNITNTIQWRKQEYDLNSNDCILQLFSYSFDGFVTSFFTPVVSGSKIVILGENDAKDPYAIKNAILSQKVTHFIVVPSLYSFILQAIDKDDLKTVRMITLAGERTSSPLIKESKDKAPHIELINEYGPTENSVATTILRNMDDKSNTLIGRSIANTKVYILDKNNRLQPVGVAGELCVSGNGVAKGYLNNPELTLQKFIENPYEKDKRMYRTGDLARWMPDGNIEYLGRIDQQVKIRGFRIELGEIESTLLQYQGIRESVVVAKTKGSENYLCAYYVSAKEISVGDLRNHIGKSLPDYMIPAYFVHMDEFPLNSSGKTDRSKLPEPEGNINTGVEYAAPETKIQETLALVWQSVLGGERIGINDNFFMLGGDSIKAIQVAARLQRYSYSVAVKFIFQYPTIKDLSSCVKKTSRIIDQSSVEGKVLFTPIQSWFFENGWKDQHHFNHSFMLYNSQGYDGLIVKKVFNEIAKHHDALRIVFKTSESKIIQYNNGPSDEMVGFVEYDFRGKANLDDEILKEANYLQDSFCLENGPLLKLGLFKASDGDHLLIVVHHLVMDGISWRIIFEDFSTGYAQAIDNKEIKFQDKTHSFMEWAKSLKAYAEGSRIKRQAAYWKKLLGKGYDTLPVDFEVPYDIMEDNESFTVQLSKEDTEKLLRKSNQAFNTEINDLLLTALGVSIKEWAGIHSVLVGMESHGRENIIEDMDVTRTVGWFTSTYPIVLDMTSNELSHLICLTKENLRQIPDKGIGYGITRYMAPSQILEGFAEVSPEIGFNYLGQFDQDQGEDSSAIKMSHISAGELIGSSISRINKLIINSVVADGQLIMTFQYNKKSYKEETIERLANCYQNSLLDIIKLCSDIQEVCLTPSDYGDITLSIDELEYVRNNYKAQKIEKIYPLSHMQEGMLFHSLMNENSMEYFQQMIYTAKGNLDISSFKNSFKQLFKRHDVLRTNFVYKDVGRPRQVVCSKDDIKIDVEDLRESFAKDPEIVNKRVVADREKGFDLSKDQLMRITVLRIQEETYKVIWSFHHILMDGWCLGIIVKEFFTLYQSLKEGKEAEIDKAFPYSSYINWLEEQDKEEGHAYWKNYLDGYSQQISVPYYKKDRISKNNVFDDVMIYLDEELTKKLETMAASNNVTVNTVFQSIWGLLLQRYNYTDDVVFGSVVSGRPSEIPGVEKIIGLFINTLPVRVSGGRDKTFSDLLTEVQKGAVESDQYAYIPLAEIQSLSSLKQGLIHHIVAFENYPLEKEVESVNGDDGNRLGFNVSDLETFEKTNYDLNVSVTLGSRLIIRISFDNGLYSRWGIEGIGKHFIQTAKAIAVNPDQRLSEIDVLTADERRIVVENFNGKRCKFPENSNIVELFEAQAEVAPDNAALIFEDEQLTYKELNEKANQLARVLRQKGVGPNVVVGLMFERSIDMIIGIFAVLKAGGAYLPIDAEYPEERINYMLQDSDAFMLLTGKNFINKLSCSIEMLIMSEELLEGSITNLGKVNSSCDLAYIIYTSGTTGKPKGVMIEHQSIINTICWRRNEYGLDSKDCVLQLFSYSFDGFVTSFFTPLASGSKVVILGESDAKDPYSIKNAIVNNGVTHFIVVPSLYSFILQAISQDDLKTVRMITLAGEKTSEVLIRESKEKASHIELVNEYGPTENSVASTILRNMDEKSNMLIGKPITNTKVYVLNNYGGLQPVGVLGELCVAGKGVARGYINNPELTSQKFIESPFEKGEKIYMTGDLARWTPDGNIEYIGRVDHQVKIRGFRIELGEIESTLLKYSSIREGLVVAKPRNSENYLCAYYISDNEINVGELRGHIGKSLPDYMIPSYFVYMKEFPLNSSGKIDRSMLPEPEGDIDTGVEYEAPTNETEEILASMWKDILGSNLIGINDNFFAIGGHSLKVTMMVSRIHKVFGVHVPLKEVFRIPTVKELSKLIMSSTDNTYSDIEVAEEREYYPVSSAQKRLFVLDKLEGSNSTSYNIPGVYIVEGELSLQRIKDTFNALIARHETLRTSFIMVDGEPVQKIEKEINFEINVKNVEENQVLNLVNDFVRPFDLSNGPLLRVELLKINDKKHIFMFDTHHIISDGVSMGILVKEFNDLYNGAALNPINIQYKDFTLWQIQRAKSGIMQKQEEFWTNTFAGEIPVLNLPTDFARPPIQAFEGDRITFGAGENTSRLLKELALKTGSTLYMVLLASYNAFLMRYTGQEDIVVGTPTSGRPHENLNNIIGMFVNTLALRNNPKGDLPFTEFLKNVKDNTLEAFENQDYQFEELVDNLALKRDTSRNPVFDTMFSLQNTEEYNEEPGKLVFRPYVFENNISKFDLSIDAIESNEMIYFSMEYCTKLFKQGTIQRMTEHFVNFLSSIAASPDEKLSNLGMLSSEEEKNLIDGFAGQKIVMDESKNHIGLFQEWAKNEPSRVAVIYKDEIISYGELNKKANKLSRILSGKGLVKDDLVGVLLERSPLMMEAVVSIWKSGGAYIPIDVDYPDERVLTILEESKAPFIITLSRFVTQKIRDTYEGIIIELDTMGKEIEKESDENLDKDISLDNMAYVIFTSGSTGKPKGAMIEHRGMLNHMYGEIKELEITKDSVIAQNASHCFDVSVWQFFLSLIAGAKTAIYPNDVVMDPVKFTQSIIKDGVSVLEVVPSYLTVMLDYVQDKNLKLKDLKCLLITGETVKPSIVKRWFEICPNIKMVNAYGPAEASDDIAQYTMTSSPEFDSIPVGKPIQNVNIYIVDAWMNLCPVGVVGEICVSGIAVGRGYLNNPERTEEVFIDDPFIGESGVRLYKTGDLGRWLPDGNIEFYGRKDYQVKIRGFRIELGEIETVLSNHPLIVEAAVVDRVGDRDIKYLCGYYVAREELEVQKIREYLSQYLPEYMIPTYLIELSQMPLSANGKIDRKALPEPDGSMEHICEPPSNVTEKRLFEIWKNILKSDNFGVTENFFEVGGHSLKAAGLTSHIHKEFQVEMPLIEVFKRRTIREMSEFIDNANESSFISIQPVEERDYYPLSSAQKRLYILNQLEGGSTTYNMPGAIEIEGLLDIERLNDAFQKILQKHESLRTSFHMIDGEPVQKINKGMGIKIELHTVKEDELGNMISSFIRPFSLDEAPLIRVAVFKINDTRNVLAFDIHHIVSDGVSETVLVNDFAKAYVGEQIGEQRIQYKDYAVWQNHYNTTDAMNRQKEYWSKTLSGTLPVLNLPTDYQRPQVMKFNGDNLTFGIDSDMKDALNQIASSNGSTLFMVLIAAYNTLLYKMSGQEDIIIGTPTAGRPHPDLENIIGMFVNTLVMRNYPQDEKTFTDFLQEVRDNSIEAYQNQDYQFEEIVAELDIKRDMSRNAIFDTMFVLQNIGGSESEEDMNLLFKPYELSLKASKFDITMAASEKDDGIEFLIDYCTSLFNKDTIERIAQYFINVLKQVVKNPSLALSEIEIISDEDKHKILCEFNDTDISYPESTLHGLVSIQAKTTPDNVAAIFENESLTYREMDELSNRIAHQLKQSGVKSGDVVGIMTTPSLEMVYGMLGILKAGGAYLPIDPEYPTDRISFIMEDADVGVILTNTKPRAELKLGNNIIDLSKESLINYPSTPVVNDELQNDLAYVIYTSGTTGKPKGVMGGHRSISDRLQWRKETYDMGMSHKVLILISSSFDAFITTIFTPLISGAKVIITTDYNNPEEVRKLIVDHKITHFSCVPTLYQAILESMNEGDADSLIAVTLGGESLKSNLVRLSKEKNKATKIVNEYGPTENGVVSTFAYDIKEDEKITIGIPVANNKAYILDRNLKPVPLGVTGELCVSGIGLSKGYLNRPELTADKFIENPFLSGEMLYRTGDLARWMPDGTIDFIGRLDYQVKVRGYRIELGEIENVIVDTLAKDVVVEAIEEENGEKALCAYVVGSEALEVSELRASLLEKLPVYMVPSYFVVLDKLPLTSNGKIDRRALPKPEKRERANKIFKAPVNDIQRCLSDIWSDLLNIDEISIDDNFFELGGHSLKVSQMVLRIHKEMNAQISMRDVFKNPTIEGVSQCISNSKDSIYSSIDAADSRDYYPMSSAQKRIYVLDKLDVDGTSYNMAEVMILKGKIDKDNFSNAFKSLVNRHEAFRTSFGEVDGEYIQKIHPQVDFQVKFGTCTEKEIPKLANDFIRAFDLSKAPLLRVELLELSEDTYVLMFDMHHIMSDGVSMNILINEFAKIYQGLELPALRIQYKDYAVWQQELVQNEAIKEQEDFWLDTFSGEIPVLNIATDHPRPVLQSFEGDVLSFSLDKDVTKSIKELAAKSGSTLYMVLLTSYNILLHKYTGQEDIIVGSPLAGRPHADLENIIGMFINTLALRNYPRGEASFNEFLDEVKENTLKAFENQNYQFEELVEKLSLVRDMSRNPLFDTMFSLQNTGTSQKDEIDDFVIQPYGVESKISKFDLSLDAMESADRIHFSIEYCTKLYKKETIQRMAEHFINLLNCIAISPNKKISELNILSTEEEKVLVESFIGQKVEMDESKIHIKLFEDWAYREPDRTAIIYKDKSISYEELNKKANRLSRILTEKGLSNDGLVGVLLERSPLLMEAVVGIWKSGGAYIPLDVDYPCERILTILEESKAPFIITLSSFVTPKIREAYNGTIVELDIMAQDIENKNCENPNCDISLDDMSYVIYTSGSTGKPKGAMIEHRGMLNHMYGEIKELGITKDSVIAQNASHCFDVSVWQFFTALITGAKTAIYPNDVVMDPTKFIESIINDRVSVLEVVPSYLTVMLDYIEDKNLSLKDLKYLLITGETVKPSLVRRWFEVCPDIKMVNAYGPAEASDDIAQYTMTSAPMAESVPVGKPIQNVNIYIADPWMNLCPVGVVGEICVAGIAVGRGYLNNPEKTEEVFINDPFINREGVRLYRTGDLGRWLADGNIEFYGRKDYQVKIRGFRIELGEIESVFANHPAIKEAAVIDMVGDRDIKYLCGYYVTNESVDVQKIREHLGQYLPEYMVPTYLVELPFMPLSSNGKIDRKALPEPSGAMEHICEPPATETETKLLEIWYKILNNNNIGVLDSFFEVGGHSLKATSLVSAIHKEFGVELQLIEVFKSKTVRELSNIIDSYGKTRYIGIEKVGNRDYYPLSSAQKRLFVLNEMQGANTTYNMPGSFVIKGKLDVERLKYVFQTMVMRHESFRTSFEIRDGEPVQIIKENIEFDVEVIEMEEKDLNKTIDSFVKPFNMQIAPLLRVKLIKLSDENFVLLMDKHHIIADGVSDSIMTQEFAKLYNGMELTLPKIQYKDYAVWQNELMTSGKMKKQEEFWMEIFKGDIPVLNLPNDLPRPVIKSFEGDAYNFSVDNEIKNGLNSIAVQTGSTMFMVLMAAYNTLIYRYTGQDDVVVGTPLAGRVHNDLENVIGMFVNTLAIRNRPEGNKTFIDFLNEVRDTSIRVFDNQDYQFEELVEKLNIKKDTSRNALIDTMLVFQNVETGDVSDLGELDFRPFELSNQISKFDLSLIAGEAENSLEFTFEYCTKLFSSSFVSKFATHFVNLIKSIVKNPLLSIKDLDLMSDFEIGQVVDSFNKTDCHYPEKLLHQLFEEQVVENPKKTAIVFKKKKLRYIDLNIEANHIAWALKSKGIRAGEVVGIMSLPSFEMIAGILGVLKAGGAYLPISPDYPKDRINFMISDGGVSKLLIQDSAMRPEEFEGECILLGSKELESYQDTNLPLASSVDDLAYVIYTSGTTGKPKGVMVEHGAISDRIQWRRDEYRFDYAKRVLVLMSFSFDAFIATVFTPLASGAYIVMLEDNKDPVGIKNAISNEKITHISTVPSMYNAILDCLKFEDAKSLEVITLGGEKVTPEIIEKTMKINPHIEIANEYGPTENAVISTILRNTQQQSVISIGKPVANSTAYVLDQYNKPVPVGVIGELCVGGNGLARGYLNAPELSAQKFVISPFDNTKRIYKTGDLARWLPDGCIDFIGRVDEQVKIRGYRVELSEIEVVMRSFNNIKDAVVKVVGDSGSTQRICGYYVADGKVSEVEFKGYLAGGLPQYMIPEYLIELTNIPLTPNGKVDKKALPEIERSESGVAFVAPSNETEEKLSKICTDMLDGKSISVEADMFEEGFNSLRMITFVYKVHEELFVKLPIVEIYRMPTIRAISEFITKSDFDIGKYQENFEQTMVLLNKRKEFKLFAFPPIAGYGFVYKGLADLVDSYSFYAFDFIESTDFIEEYIRIITEEQPEGPYVLLGYSIGGNVAYEVAKELIKRGKDVTDLIFMDSFMKPVKVDMKDKKAKKAIKGIVKEEIGKVLEGFGMETGYNLKEAEVRDRLQEKMYNYFKYSMDMVNEGEIDANIHLLTSDGNDLEKLDKLKGETGEEYKVWSISEGKKLSILKGYGDHDRLLEEENLHKNAKLINEVLENIKNNK